MRRILLAFSLFSLALLTLAPRPALASSSGQTALASSSGQTGGKFVGIVDFAFTPATVTIPHGFVITWKNLTTGTQHTTTSDNNIWDSGVLNPGQTFTFTFTTPGTYTYHCNIHPFMKGTIIVQ